MSSISSSPSRTSITASTPTARRSPSGSARSRRVTGSRSSSAPLALGAGTSETAARAARYGALDELRLEAGAELDRDRTPRRRPDRDGADAGAGRLGTCRTGGDERGERAAGASAPAVPARRSGPARAIARPGGVGGSGQSRPAAPPLVDSDRPPASPSTPPSGRGRAPRPVGGAGADQPGGLGGAAGDDSRSWSSRLGRARFRLLLLRSPSMIPSWPCAW